MLTVGKERKDSTHVRPLARWDPVKNRNASSWERDAVTVEVRLFLTHAENCAGQRYGEGPRRT